MLIKKRLTELLGEHEALQAHLNFLTGALGKLEIQPNENVKQTAQRIWCFRCGLYDLKEGMSSHMEVDELVFRSLTGDVPLEEMQVEHREIIKRLNLTIEWADRAIEKADVPGELNRCAASIKQEFSRTRELIDGHEEKENKLLQALQNLL
jgi:hypothetical protein